MNVLKTFQNPHFCSADSVAGGAGGGDEEPSVERACAQSVLSPLWALKWLLLGWVIFAVRVSLSLQ